VPNVLVIDDERPIRALLREVLAEQGYDVTEAANGVEGVRRARERRPDLVITDILMPDKDGLETILELRAVAPGLPVIAISGGSAMMSMDVLSAARRFGARHVFSKPFDPLAVVAAVSELLDGPPETPAPTD
jgi:CheY-like chemotaxis protein